jgi:hypothetical protein
MGRKNRMTIGLIKLAKCFENLEGELIKIRNCILVIDNSMLRTNKIIKEFASK